MKTQSKLTSVSVLTSKVQYNIAVCDKFWLYLGNFWMVVDGCGGCGWLWVIVSGFLGGYGQFFGWLWVVVDGCWWLWKVVGGYWWL